MFTLHQSANVRASCPATRTATSATRLVTRAQVPTTPSAMQPEELASTSYAHREEAVVGSLGRRAALLSAVLLVAAPSSAQAVGFTKTKKRKLTPEDYSENEDVGLKIVELEEGRQGDTIQPGDRVTVHYDCLYRGIDVVSSRQARLLGGNRTVAEPYSFVAGEATTGVARKKINDNANGLFAGQGGPKPPIALSRAVLGMKKGGKRSILIDDPAKGYPKGEGELPVGATFELKVEVLEVTKASA